MFVSHEDTTKCTQLSKRGGGAALCKSNTAIVMATYTKDKPTRGFLLPKGFFFFKTASCSATRVLDPWQDGQQDGFC